MKKSVKKILLIIMMMAPLFIKAEQIENFYLDSEIDIAGNLIVKEVIDFNGIIPTKPINLYYKNDLGNSKYEASSIILGTIGYLDSMSNISGFYGEDFKEKHIKEMSDYTTLDDGEYLNITFEKEGIYYIEYTVYNLCVKYNDASEMYYKYLYNFNHDIKTGMIINRLPMKSSTYEVYAHSNKKVVAGSDSEKAVSVFNINDFKSSDNFDARIIFDNSIFSVSINEEKIVNDTILDKVDLEENASSILVKKILLVIGIIVLIFVILALYSYFKIDVTHIKINNKKIDKNMKLLLLSDLHDRNINKKIVKIVEKENPDYIIMSGDMIDGNYDDEEELNEKTSIFIELCNQLKDKKIYYTFGNHEFYMSKELFKKYNRILNDNNITLLNNDSANLSRNVILTGFMPDIDYYEDKKKEITKEYLNSKVNKINNKKYNIITYHNPLKPNIISENDYDLMLSGHVHGGVIRYPALLSPEFKFFPKYNNGLYKVNDMDLVVSRGLGFCSSIPFRINNPGHIVVIDLSKM